MANVFYDHLIPWEMVDTYVVTEGLAGDERIEFITLIDELVHTEVMIVLLEHIPPDQHEAFLVQFHADPSAESHLDFLNSNTQQSIEPKIIEAARDLFLAVLFDTDERDSTN